MNAQTNPLDYQECMQSAALAFLERHQGEHLADLGQFLSRTINHLVESLDVKKSIATILVHRAYSDLVTISARQRIDLQASQDTTVVITDPIRGIAWSVPAYLIYEYLIAAGHGTCITPAT